MTADRATVGVVTMTRHRPELLDRAVASVRGQRTSATVTHLVVVDECPRTREHLSGAPERVHYVERRPEEEAEHGSRRCAKLRNLGTRLLEEADWIAFLDDDNEWAPDHLESLLEHARDTGHPAVHSQRELVLADARPYLRPMYPWITEPERSAQVYAALVAEGVFTPGSGVMADRVSPGASAFPPERIVDPAVEPIVMVDPNEWLLRREVLLKFPFREDLTPDPHNGLFEDGRFLLDLILAGVPISGSGRPTLRYYLGGFSNEEDSRWVR